MLITLGLLLDGARLEELLERGRGRESRTRPTQIRGPVALIPRDSGLVVAVARLTDCRADPGCQGGYLWELAGVVAVPPVAYRRRRTFLGWVRLGRDVQLLLEEGLAAGRSR